LRKQARKSLLIGRAVSRFNFARRPAMKMMDEDDIPDFVEAVAATGCDITAVGEHSYIIGDADLPYAECYAVQDELDAIAAKFGERDHLKYEIISYLHSIGRSYIEETLH
jgi:hypothetical protein